ncbi:MAG: hypothetical protein AAGD06_25585, partial [Acidobacteriota bacterium]
MRKLDSQYASGRSRPRSLSALLVSAGLAFTMACAGAQPFTPYGADLQANSHTPSDQQLPTVAKAPGGRYVVTWSSFSAPSGARGVSLWVVARAFEADGTPLGPDVQVTDKVGGFTDVAAAPNGEYLVVWNGLESDVIPPIPTLDVWSRRLNADGQPVGADVRLNVDTAGNQQMPQLAAAADGTYVVTWGDDGATTTNVDVRWRRVDSAGQPQGAAVTANTLNAEPLDDPADVAVGADGRVLVTWQSPSSNGTDGSGTSVQARLFEADGTPVGPQFQVNTVTNLDQTQPAVAALPGGGYAVLWVSDDLDPAAERVTGQILDASGNLVGGELVMPPSNGTQAEPAVAALHGGFLAVWDTALLATDNSGTAIQGQSYDAAGAAVGSGFQVNTHLPTNQAYAGIAGSGEDFVVVWSSFSSAGDDDDGSSIQSRRVLDRL